MCPFGHAAKLAQCAQRLPYFVPADFYHPIEFQRISSTACAGPAVAGERSGHLDGRGFAVPSTVSDASATLSIGSPQWQQGPTQAQQTDGQPFAAILDATAAAPTPPASTPSQVANQGPSPTAGNTQSAGPSGLAPTSNANAASNSTSGTSTASNSTGNASAASNSTSSASTASNSNTASSTPKAQAAFNARSGANAGSNAPAATKGSVNFKTNANAGFNRPTVTGGNAAPQATPSVPPTANAASGAKPQTATATAATTNHADGAVPAKAGLSAVQQTGLPASVIKASSNDGKADNGKDSNATDSAAATPPPAALTQAQAAANPTQPVATAITVNTAENAAPAPATASASELTVGEQAKPRARLTIAAMVAGQGAPSAQDTAETASAKNAPPAGQVDNTASAGANSTDGAAKAEAAPAHAAQPTPTQAADDPTVSAQTSGPASANADRTAAQATQPSSVPTSDNAVTAPNTQGHETAKASGVDGLPNFGFAASPTSASSATAAPASSGTASNNSVPVAGLAVAIAARAQQGSNQFDIKLSPPELGRIDVQLNVDSNGQVTSHMTVERPETLQLLQSQQPQLQNALEQAGLTTADNGLQFSLRDQSFTGQNNGSGSRSTPTQLVIPEPGLAPIAATQIYTRVGLGGGIDIRV